MGGGFMLYIKETLKCAEVKLDIAGLECLTLNVIMSPKKIFNVVTLYNPPSHETSFYYNLEVLFGDFKINWFDKCSKQKLKSITVKHKFNQLIKCPTRITKTRKTLIDLAFTNKPERVIKTYNHLTDLSDHNMILVVRKFTKTSKAGLWTLMVVHCLSFVFVFLFLLLSLVFFLWFIVLPLLKKPNQGLGLQISFWLEAYMWSIGCLKL